MSSQTDQSTPWPVIMDRAADYLKSADFFIIPVAQMRDDLSDETLGSDLLEDDLVKHLRDDERFRVLTGSDVQFNLDDYPYLNPADVKRMGFNQGPRVMLKTRVPTRREVIIFLLNKANQTFETLKKAWDLRPQNDEAVEDRLLSALAKAQKLQRELNAVLDGRDDAIDLDPLKHFDLQ